ncbi:cyclopropane fatty acid synthase [Gordonia hirsuta DSM 44140 = NBRC 16056]|uniref:Cyclopropane fatty acid synthase n=1 Tax=Gordonia hirsuta DSM 44140 = NBRC 16056 TaxID=1121927 RepID=L7LDD9_9ACTN|nr:class I SAM-dependent methyltransferase [Gordonia hirsuta]GAC58043.1 cyclopropane fatty acid synthase [Gordonia hirsuta DSM 44140 = NBRC 16056]
MTINEECTVVEDRIDPDRWPDVARVPRSPIRGAAAGRLFAAALRKVPVTVEFADGPGGAPSHAGAPAARMLIRNPQALYRRLGSTGLIGFGEAFMAQDWTTDDLVGVLTPLAERMAELVPAPLQRLRPLVLPGHPADERNSIDNTRSNIARHYDLSNDLFAAFLDETLSYSSAYFGSDDAAAEATWSDLAPAQRAKIDRLLDLAAVGPGTRLLEIGTGWGELCVRAAERGAQVRSLTLSSRQRELARARVAAAGLGDRVQIDLLDYRLADGEYDAVVSVEMLEAVGREFWPEYFQTVERVLAPGGRAAIQVITMPHARMLASAGTYTWVHKYIFPGGQLPSIEAIREVVGERTGLQVTDELAMGRHYARTLRLWRERFEGRTEQIDGLGFDAVFRRMWTFYLAYSEAGFGAGYLDVYQLRLDKP